MAELRPRGMSQGELAELLKGAGFTACSKAAVSLAERSKESGVQFTPEAKNAARRALNSTADTNGGGQGSARPTENRKNGRKTTVWFDDETRIWLETRAYMEDSCVGEIVRRIVAEARTRGTDCHGPAGLAMTEKAASDAAASEAAEN